MGRFYFHLREGNELIPDEEGSEFPDVTAALRQARLNARDLLVDALKAGKERVPDAFIIVDDAGRSVATLPLAAVLPEPLKA